MTVVVPDPVPLGMPAGDPGALEDVAADVAGAASHLQRIGVCLTGASAPGWRGNDATAAARQVATVTALTEELSAAVAAAARRLRAHHELLAEVRRRITVLRREQDEDFRVAWGRLSRIEDYRFVAMTDGPEGVAVVEELQAADAGRRREHARLLDELAADAAGTIRTLAEASAVVGGTGRRGDGARATAHLAAALPGWGEAELRRRGEEMASRLTGDRVPPSEDVNALARDVVDLAGSAAFARGLLAGLGVDGMRWLLVALGLGTLGASSPVARVLAAALGAAVPSGRAADPVREVLTATYVAADGRSGYPGATAIGLAAVLLAGSPSGQAAVRTETAAVWARQLLRAERGLGTSPGTGAVPAGWDPRAADPAALALAVVAAGGGTGPAADLLADRAIWDTALARSWADGGEVLARVVALAGAEPGSAGRAAVGNGLEALGRGLSDDGEPRNWTVRPDIAAAVAGPLAGGVAAHISVVTDVLGVAVAGTPEAEAVDALRGLGYLTLDRDAAATVAASLVDWVREQPADLDGTSVDSPLPAIAVPGAFFAVQEYGQRLAHALAGFEARAAAETAQTTWNWTVGLLAELPPGHWGVAAGLVEGYLAIFLGADGTWDNGRDPGLSFSQGAATREVLAVLEPEHAAASRTLGAQAVAAYARAAAAVGAPEPPTSPRSDYVAPLLDALADAGMGRIEGAVGRHRPRTGEP